MNFLIASMIICVLWAVTASLLIARDLQKKGLKVNFIFLRLLIIRYLYQYRKLTKEQTGRVGPLFYHYVVPLNLALALVIVLVILAY
jgi:hypothetical protein